MLVLILFDNTIVFVLSVFGDVMEFKGYDGGWCPRHHVGLVYSQLYEAGGCNDQRRLASGKIIWVHLAKHKKYLGVLWRCPVRYCHTKREEKNRDMIFCADRDSKGRVKADRRRI